MAICSVIIVVGVIAIAAILVNRLNNQYPISPSANYHIENYDGETYYIFGSDYTGDYDLQKGDFVTAETLEYNEHWYNIDEDDFNTEQIMFYSEYVNFCQKWNLAQKYHDSSKNYVTISYLAPGSAYINVNLADVMIESPNVNIYLYDYSRGVVADMPLYITPTPDSTIRILMLFEALDSPIKATEQHLATPTRTGFTAVEWGGVELKRE